MTIKVKLASLIFLFLFSFGLIWAMIVPGSSEAPDEHQHVEMVHFLKKNHKIPVFNKETEITQTSYIKDELSGAYYSMAYNSPVSYLPFLPLNNSLSGKKADVITMRVISSVLIALFGLFMFLALSRLKENYRAAAIISLSVALIPQVIYSAGYVNIEPFALAISAISLYFFISARKNYSLKNYLLLGFFLGILALCKINYSILILYFSFFLILDLRKNTKALLFNKYIMSALVFLAVSSWWWIKNFFLYGDPTIMGYIGREIIAKAPQWAGSPEKAGYNFFTIFKVPVFAERTFKGFYANLGSLNIYLPDYIYIISLVLLITSLLICLKTKLLRTYAISFIIISATALAVYTNKNLADFSPQGRHLFPLLIPLSLVLFSALDSIKAKAEKLLGTVWLTFFLSVSMYSLALLVHRYYVFGSAYMFEPRVMSNFSWQNIRLNEYQKLLNFIFSENPSFLRTNFFLALSAITALSIISIYYLVLKTKSNSDNVPA